MNIDTLTYLCRSITKTFGLFTRIYEDDKPVYYYSASHLSPDPATLERDALKALPQKAGVYITKMFQLYGFYKTQQYLIVIGPSAAVWESNQKLDNFLFSLAVPAEERTEFLRKLNCVPEIPAERMAWMVAMLATSITGHPFLIHNIEILTNKADLQENVIAETMHTLENEDDTVRPTVVESYRVEKYMSYLIEHGELELLREFIASMPRIVGGPMASNTLRQTKNEFICTATLASRCAITGGMDAQVAFRLSDVYIQKSELLEIHAQIIALQSEMILDFTSRVYKIKYGISTNSKLFNDCARYVTQNIYRRITAEDIARELNLSRAYLCTQFKQVAGMGLAQYIAAAKIAEAQRMLRFTDSSIADIGYQLAFSSQSHFHNIFKKETGETPLAYRQKNV